MQVFELWEYPDSLEVLFKMFFCPIVFYGYYTIDMNVEHGLYRFLLFTYSTFEY